MVAYLHRCPSAGVNWGLVALFILFFPLSLIVAMAWGIALMAWKLTKLLPGAFLAVMDYLVWLIALVWWLCPDRLKSASRRTGA